MKESGHQWPVISEEDQARHLQRLSGTVLFSERIADPAVAEAARTQYLSTYPEQPLLAYVINENSQWLAELARRGTEAESDKYLLMASINLVNCIAFADARAERA
jgi:hypothetical protein